ncbi:unnamed protein product, partial [Rotaria magnacalcarata]
MLTDETNTNTSTSMESACLPIGCSVSAKYRGAFCSAQVKTIERQVKLKIVLLDTNDTIIISEEQIVEPKPLRIGNTVTIRLPSSNHHDLNPHLSRSSLIAILNNNDNYDEKQAIIKQIYDNSIYTVVFNDGDEKSLRRSSLCLQGIRLYQTRIDQRKPVEDISTTTPSSSLTSATMNSNDPSSIVAVRRHENNNQHVFPALILKRKSFSDYIWVKSFLNGREYIVHKINDVEPYKNNSRIRSLCRSTSKQATAACDKFIKYDQIPIVWKKAKSKHVQDDDNSTSESNSSTSESDFDDSDDETIEEKDSFIAQLFAFMDERGTPINNIPKIHNYDLDLHRLFNIVRMLGGYNKVTKNEQWNKVYIKMGLPNESSPKNGRLIENTYKKYLFPYEDLSKKLGTMTMPSAYYNSRASTNNDSRRSLLRVRQQSEEKHKTKQPFRKRQSTDSKPILSSTKIQPTSSRRKTIILNKAKLSAILSSSTSDSETSENEITSSSSSTNRRHKKPTIHSPIYKSTIISNEKKKLTKIIPSSLSSPSLCDSQKKREKSNSATNKKTKSTTDMEHDMKPVIKIAKISPDILKNTTFPRHAPPNKSISTKTSKTHDRTSKHQSNKGNSDTEQSKANTSSPICPSFSEPMKQNTLQDVTILPAVAPTSSPPPPPSIKEEPSKSVSLFTTTASTNNTNDDTSVPSIFQTLIPSSSITNQPADGIENFEMNPNKRSYSDENFEFNNKTDEQLSPFKRSRHSMSSQNSDELINNKKSIKDSPVVNNNAQLTFEDILVNDILLVQWELNGNKEYYARCIEKNDSKKELCVHYNGFDLKYHEWIEFDRVIKRHDEIDFDQKQISIAASSIFEKNEQKINMKIENTTMNSIDQNNVWKDFEIVSSNVDEFVPCSSTFQFNDTNNQALHSNIGLRQYDYKPTCILPTSSDDEPMLSIDDAKSIDDKELIPGENSIQQITTKRRSSNIKTDPTQNINIENILPKSETSINQLQAEEETMSISSIIDDQSINSTLPFIAMPSLIPDNRRIYTRQQKRRTFREPNAIQDSSICTKRRTRFDTDINSNFNSDCTNNSDHSPVPIDQQSIEVKRYRTVVKRSGKRPANQLDNENEDLHLNSPMSATLRQQLDNMFKNRSSRYNFLDLNSNLTGDNRLAQLKDRMRQCQKVFFNLKSALRKVEKQKKVFVRRQKSSNTEIIPYEIFIFMEIYKLTNLPNTLYYIPNFINNEEEEYLVSCVNNVPRTRWVQLRNRRLQNWGGQPLAKGMIQTESLPKWLETFTERILKLGNETVYPDNTFQFNHCLVNEYEAGQGIMPHTDGPVYYPIVTTISLQSHTVIEFYRPIDSNDKE